MVRESEVWETNRPLWDAFHRLSRHRQMVGGVSTGVQPLPYRDLQAFARDFGFADTTLDLDEFVTVMEELDAVYLTFHANRAAKHTPTPTQGRGA